MGVIKYYITGVCFLAAAYATAVTTRGQWIRGGRTDETTGRSQNEEEIWRPKRCRPNTSYVEQSTC